MKLSLTTEMQKAARELSWDTEFFGVKIAMVEHPDVDQWAYDNTIGGLFMLVECDDVEGLHRAEDHGFRVMDVRVELQRPTAWFPAHGLRDVEMSDTEPLVAIAREAHRITRFYADPRFPDERCDDLYEAWIRNSMEGWASAVLVATSQDGYVTVHVSGKSASIGLIAVDEKHRRAGLGSTLCHGAIGRAHGLGATDIKVVTQARNTPALRLFSRCGFQIRRTSYWLHKWYA